MDPRKSSPSNQHKNKLFSYCLADFCEQPACIKGMCSKHYRRSHYEKNKERVKEQGKDWYANNKIRKEAAVKARRKKRYHSDPAYRERHLLKAKTWVEKNNYNTSPKERARKDTYRKANRERCREACREHFRKNKKYYTAKTAKRRAALLRAILPGTDLKAIEAFYKNCPPGHEVDHIEALQGKDVCGLHNIHNLRYLTVFENRSKGNRREAA